MPIRDFSCSGCKVIKEVLIKRGDPYPKCEDCGEEMKPSLSYPVMFMLKGQGWTGSDYTRK